MDFSDSPRKLYILHTTSLDFWLSCKIMKMYTRDYIALIRWFVSLQGMYRETAVPRELCTSTENVNALNANNLEFHWLFHIFFLEIQTKETFSLKKPMWNLSVNPNENEDSCQQKKKPRNINFNKKKSLEIQPPLCILANGCIWVHTISMVSYDFHIFNITCRDLVFCGNITDHLFLKHIHDFLPCVKGHWFYLTGGRE